MSPLLVHILLEALAYTIGLGLFRVLRARHGHPADTHPEGGWVLVGAVFGAVVGSKLLDLAQYPTYVAAHLTDPAVLFGGKTIVGGLVGGWIGVEATKRAIGLRRSTGDLLVLPLIVGMSIGRLGCLLSGPGDHTGGALTDVPWAIDQGDGPRHPAPLYEVLFLVLFGVVQARIPLRREGDRFLLFMCAYLVFRLVVDFWKAPFGPDPLLPVPDLLPIGLTAIQTVALLGACYAASRLVRSPRRPRSTA
ncbi:MAG: prolipoprotein diacylglyceryl transferase [Pseudomonadota bacterium]|nr:prolipoprotein diacylglyceryl transferase [Pseudomonadota bacterium]